jgi:hypothetical protein
VWDPTPVGVLVFTTFTSAEMGASLRIYIRSGIEQRPSERQPNFLHHNLDGSDNKSTTRFEEMLQISDYDYTKFIPENGTKISKNKGRKQHIVMKMR